MDILIIELKLKKNFMRKYSFKAIINGKEFFPKGFYYHGKFIILVGCEKSNHTIRRKEKINDVEIFMTENNTYNS